MYITGICLEVCVLESAVAEMYISSNVHFKSRFNIITVVVKLLFQANPCPCVSLLVVSVAMTMTGCCWLCGMSKNSKMIAVMDLKMISQRSCYSSGYLKNFSFRLFLPWRCKTVLCIYYIGNAIHFLFIHSELIYIFYATLPNHVIF